MPVGYSYGTTNFSGLSLLKDEPGAGTVSAMTVLASGGAAAVPAYTFLGDTDTGLYRSAANVLDVAVGGARAGSWSSIGGGTNFVVYGSGANAIGPAVVPASSELSLGFYRSGVSTVALSYGTLNLYTQSVRLSKRTVADATGLNIGELAVVFAASGISLIYSSGASYYIVGGSATSAAQA